MFENRRHARPLRRHWILAALSGVLVLAVALYFRVSGLGTMAGGSELARLIVSALQIPVVSIQVVIWSLVVLLLHLAWPCLVIAIKSRLLRGIPSLQKSTVLAVALLVFAWLFVLHVNAAVFPHSALVDLFGVSSAPPLVVVLILTFGLVLMPLAAVLALVGWVMDSARVAVVLGISALAALGFYVWHGSWTVDDTDQPHLVLIGVDGVRPDVVGRESDGRVVGPVMKGFLDGAIHFPDATTPQARTFPAWSSILTAKYPVESGIRANLQAVDETHKQQYLTHRLREAGYSTAYFTDEVRFSNIDHTFGFDYIVGPVIGVTDFLLGHISDIPLINLVANVPLIERALPWVSGNRAAASAYIPATFSRMVDRNLRKVARQGRGEPLFLAIHYCTAHWPYTYGDLRRLLNGVPGLERRPRGPHESAYLSSVAAVDRQLASLLDRLEHSGILDNAIVVLLSDHGETLLADDVRLRHGLTGELRQEMPGHGTDVFSQGAYQVVLGFRDFRNPQAPGGRSHADVPADLVDVLPTVFSMAGLDIATGDGSGTDLLTLPRDRVRLRETGISALAIGRDIDTEALAREGATFYQVTPQGRMIVRERIYELTVRNKDRSVQSGTLMAARRGNVPDSLPDSARQRLLIADLDNQLWWHKDEFPDRERAAQLFDTFGEYFGDDF